MPRALNASISGTGIRLEPVATARMPERSVLSQSGCWISACIIAGTITISVGLSVAIACSAVSGAKRDWIVTVAPSCSAGVVWMLSPPTWNIGRKVRM